MRNGLISMATTPGKLEEVNVRKAYFQFMAQLSPNEKKMSVDKFVKLLSDELPVDWSVINLMKRLLAPLVNRKLTKHQPQMMSGKPQPQMTSGKGTRNKQILI